MFDTLAQQYGLIVFAVLVLLAIKYYAMNKSYNKQLSSFVHPETLVPQIKKQLRKVKDSDPRIILAQNLNSLQKQPTRMRSVAILVALMKEQKMNLDPFVNRIKNLLKEVQYDGQPEYVRKYRDYILLQI